MSDIIRLLPDNVANQIAAGEVVQRPASAVKEMLENSVDSGASKIELVAKDSGKTLIQVIDNGQGMSETDARMAFERHATSKISNAEDIFSIHTKGFRGEALASIAAVAQVELRTKQPDQELGTQIKIAGSKVSSQDFINTPVGTQIEVRNLFYNIPARRNFLKSNQVELKHIIDEFERVALAHPEIEFSFEHNGAEIFRLPVASLRQRIVGIFGKSFNEKLVPVEEDTPMLKLSGFVGKPQAARKTRGQQFFFVNNRFIKNAYLHKAVQLAFEGLLQDDSHPSYFLYLKLDPSKIDVNIHPTKTEVKFDDERAIHTIIRAAVKHALGQYNIAPSLDFETDQQFQANPRQRDQPASPPGVYINPNFNPFAEGQKETKHSTGKSFHRPNPAAPKQNAQQWEQLLENLPEMESQGEGQISLDGLDKGAQKVFLQVGKKYFLTNHGDGLIMIHQRRAHERILYDKILAHYQEQKVASQQLLFPQRLELGAADFSLLKGLFPQLRTMGFDIDEFGQQELVINGVPLFLEKTDPKAVLEQIIEAEKDHRSAAKEQQVEKMAQSMAKVAALRSGTVIDQNQMQNLLGELFACSSPYLSPDGKVVVVNVSLGDIDKSFN